MKKILILFMLFFIASVFGADYSISNFQIDYEDGSSPLRGSLNCSCSGEGCIDVIQVQVRLEGGSANNQNFNPLETYDCILGEILEFEFDEKYKIPPEENKAAASIVEGQKCEDDKCYLISCKKCDSEKEFKRNYVDRSVSYFSVDNLKTVKDKIKGEIECICGIYNYKIDSNVSSEKWPDYCNSFVNVEVEIPEFNLKKEIQCPIGKRVEFGFDGSFVQGSFKAHSKIVGEDGKRCHTYALGNCGKQTDFYIENPNPKYEGALYNVKKFNVEQINEKTIEIELLCSCEEYRNYCKERIKGNFEFKSEGFTYKNTIECSTNYARKEKIEFSNEIKGDLFSSIINIEETLKEKDSCEACGMNLTSTIEETLVETADFSESQKKTIFFVKEPVVFASLCNDSQKTIKEFDFGDGKKLKTQDDFVYHSYENAGNYTSTLTVRLGEKHFSDKVNFSVLPVTEEQLSKIENVPETKKEIAETPEKISVDYNPAALASLNQDSCGIFRIGCIIQGFFELIFGKEKEKKGRLVSINASNTIDGKKTMLAMYCGNYSEEETGNYIIYDSQKNEIARGKLECNKGVLSPVLSKKGNYTVKAEFRGAEKTTTFSVFDKTLYC